MSHRNHTHLTPFARRTTRGKLVPNQFGAVVGTFDHATLCPHDGTRPDDNHLYLWVRIGQGEFQGCYEAAVNIQSTDSSEVQFAEVDEEVASGEVPSEGFAQAKLSYEKLGLTQDGFRAESDRDLHTQILHYAQTCDLVSVYGHTYGQGDGLHDIHQNSGEPAGSGHPNKVDQDGALVFYTRNPGGGATAHWVFLKFHTQTLS